MYAYKEFMINGACPYCGRDFSAITHQIDFTFIHRCSDCSRGLTIATTKALMAIIEPGTQSSLSVSIDKLTRDCCG